MAITWDVRGGRRRRSMLQFRRLCSGAPFSQTSWPPRKPDMRALFLLSFLLSGSVGGDLALALEGGASSSQPEPLLQAPSGTDIYYGTPGRPASEAAPRLTAADYPRYGSVDNRLAIWVVTQQHTYFGGFVLALPIFCLIIEVMGLLTRDPVAAVRYDRLARDFLRISLIAFSISSLLGVTLVAALLAFYPTFLRYITGVFKSMMGIYAVVFLAESWALYLYYYSWDRLSEGGHKWFHAAIGVVVNVCGTLLLFLANSWVSFMMSPAGVDQAGRFLGNSWHTLHTALWNPFNAHRFLADMMTGGAVVLGYSAFRFLTAKSQDQKGYYDWMGYVFLFITMAALIPMPFAGYWLMRSVYEFRQQLGVTMMGGMLTWMIVLSALSYILYKRANKVVTAPWAWTGDLVIGAVFCGALVNVIGVSVYGFYLPANVRVGLSLPQALSTLTALVIGLLVNRAIVKNAHSVGPIAWGKMPVRGQVTLFLLGMAFTRSEERRVGKECRSRWSPYH